MNRFLVARVLRPRLRPSSGISGHLRKRQTWSQKRIEVFDLGVSAVIAIWGEVMALKPSQKLLFLVINNAYFQTIYIQNEVQNVLVICLKCLKMVLWEY